MNLLTTWNVSTSVPSMSSFQISTIQMSSRRACSLKTFERLFSRPQEWYTPNRSVNYIQVSAKSLYRLTVFFKHKPHYCIKPTKKEKLSCLCINCLNHTSSSNRLTSSANLMVYHHMIPWRSTSNILIREKVLSKLMMIRQASFIHIKGS